MGPARFKAPTTNRAFPSSTVWPRLSRSRAAAVGAARAGPPPARARRDRAAARTAGRQRQIPGIARDAEDEIVGVALERELRTIRLAEDDGAARAQLRDRQLVLLGGPIRIDA